jgi:nicotinamidase-related amidase
MLSGDTALQYDRSALITIDVQRDFLDGQPFEIRGTSAALPAMRRLVESFRLKARPIIHVVRLYRADGSNVEQFRRRLFEQGARLLRHC